MILNLYNEDPTIIPKKFFFSGSEVVGIMLLLAEEDTGIFRFSGFIRYTAWQLNHLCVQCHISSWRPYNSSLDSHWLEIQTTGGVYKLGLDRADYYLVHHHLGIFIMHEILPKTLDLLPNITLDHDPRAITDYNGWHTTAAGIARIRNRPYACAACACEEVGYYGPMLRDSLWVEVSGPLRSFHVCSRCVEQRLGRSLTVEDLKYCPLSADWWKTHRGELLRLPPEQVSDLDSSDRTWYDHDTL